MSEDSKQKDKNKIKTKKVNNKRYFIFFFILILLIIVDQSLKLFFLKNNDINIKFKLGNFEIIKIKTTINTGVAFGMFKENKLVTIIIPLIIIFFIIYNLKGLIDHLFLPTVFILSGAISNLIDRIVLGYVVDYISLIHIPFFNIADAMISLGITLIIVNNLFNSKENNINNNK